MKLSDRLHIALSNVGYFVNKYNEIVRLQEFVVIGFLVNEEVIYNQRANEHERKFIDFLVADIKKESANTDNCDNN